MLYGDITEIIIAAALEVYNTKGNGFQEKIYQRALEIEMTLREMKFEREKPITIYYKEHEIGTRRADFCVENKIVVELKAVSELEGIHLNQVMNYCEAFEMEIGLLINFGAKSLEFKRIYNNKLINKKSTETKIDLDINEPINNLIKAINQIIEVSNNSTNQ